MLNAFAVSAICRINQSKQFNEVVKGKKRGMIEKGVALLAQNHELCASVSLNSILSDESNLWDTAWGGSDSLQRAVTSAPTTG